MGGVLDPQGPIGAAQRLILIDATVVMLAVVVPVIILCLGFAWWFRAGNRTARYLPDWEYSGPVELVVWSIPALIVIFLGGMAWISSHALDPGKPLASDKKPIDIQVVALDWKWLFIYPEQGVASLNRLPVPAGRPLHFYITSAGVMNSFFVPQLGSQIYAMAGMTTKLVLQADNTGTFTGRSVQYSGAGFSDMRFDVVSMEPAAFDAWVQQTKGAGGTLDAPAYARLVRPSIAVPPAAFGTVDPRLFETAIHLTVR